MKLLSPVRLFAIPKTVSYQASPSMDFSRQEYWSGLPFPSPEDLPNPGIEPRYPALQADSLPSEPPGKPKNTGVGSLPLLQGIFPTQELDRKSTRLNSSHLVRSYHLSHQGNPRILEWVAFPFSRESSQPRDRTQVSSIACGFLPVESQGKPSQLNS